MEFLWLSLFAFLAGGVDSIAGGGGLIQLPALFLFLPPELSASVPSVLGTNKLSSVCGTSLAVVQYARRLSIPWRVVLPASAAAFGLSFLGARSVTLMDPALLRPIILVLLGAVAVYTYGRRELGVSPAHRLRPGQAQAWGVAAGAAIGFYDGFFGPGTGSFLIFVFAGWLGFEFLTASASAKVVNLATNLSAIGYFAATDHVLYRYALPMAACNMLGSLVGTRLAVLHGNRFVRRIFLGVVGLLMVRLIYDLVCR